MFGDPAFWSELKKRRVVRVALVYLAVGWGVFEASDTLTGVLGLPEVTPRLVFALVVLGFPLAITLAWIYQRTPAGVERAEAYAPAGPLNLPFVGGIAVGVLAVAGLGFVFFGPERGTGPAVPGTLDPDAVAVLPFRVSAPADLSYLGGGVMDLLSARLDGAVGPSAVDPGAVVRAAEREGDDLGRVAASLGAGLVVTGSVVGSASSVVISAEYTDVRDGSLLASAEAEGHPDSLATLADRLLVELLSLSSDEYPSSIAALTSASPDALRSYLRGKEAWRAGDYAGSSAHFDEALAADSTFALAALWYVTAAGMGWETPGVGNKPEIAWRHRNRLSARDLQYLEATARSPGRTGAEWLAALERLTRDQPDRVEAWYHRGDRLFHSASMFPVTERMERTWSVWKRALDLDPGYRPIFDHMFSAVRHFSPEQREEYWRALLVLLEGQTTFEMLPGADLSVEPDEAAWAFDFDLDALTTDGLTALKWFPVWDPDHAPDDYPTTVDALLQESRRRVGIDVSLSATLNSELYVHLALGRPARAEEVREEAIDQGVRDRLGRQTIYDALQAGVAPEDAEASVAAIDTRLGIGERCIAVDDRRARPRGGRDLAAPRRRRLHQSGVRRAGAGRGGASSSPGQPPIRSDRPPPRRLGRGSKRGLHFGLGAPRRDPRRGPGWLRRRPGPPVRGLQGVRGGGRRRQGLGDARPRRLEHRRVGRDESVAGAGPTRPGGRRHGARGPPLSALAEAARGRRAVGQAGSGGRSRRTGTARWLSGSTHDTKRPRSGRRSGSGGSSASGSCTWRSDGV